MVSGNDIVERRHRLSDTRVHCIYCGAKMWLWEMLSGTIQNATFNLCCSDGKVRNLCQSYHRSHCIRYGQAAMPQHGISGITFAPTTMFSHFRLLGLHWMEQSPISSMALILSVLWAEYRIILSLSYRNKGISQDSPRYTFTMLMHK